MKYLLSLFLIITSVLYCDSLYAQKNIKAKSIKISTSEFKSLIWDFEENKNDFVYIGKKPAIVCFYSTQSSGSKASSPILDNLGKDYKGKFDIYIIDAEQEKELIELFQIKEYPAFMFVAKKGEPQIYVGFKTKEQLSQLIDLILK